MSGRLVGGPCTPRPAPRARNFFKDRGRTDRGRARCVNQSAHDSGRAPAPTGGNGCGGAATGDALTIAGTADNLISMPRCRHRTVTATPRRRRLVAAIVHAAVLAVVLPGCAVLPVAALGGALLQAGGGALLKTGTEYTAGGTVRRTFTIPVEDVHAAVLEVFCRADLAVDQDEIAKNGVRAIESDADHRTVYVRLLPLTRSLTSMEVVVKRNFLASDKATASELVAETEQALAERPALAPRLDRGPDGLPRP